MKVLITGGCGFLGTNLAAQALRNGDTLVLFDNLSRVGAAENLAWLRGQGAPVFVKGDVRDAEAVARVMGREQPTCVFHLAGQVAMTTSIKDPRADFETNALGTLNVLEALRLHAPRAAMIYSSTNKVYGDLEQYRYEETATRYRCLDRPDGFDESTPLEFHSPYGCSKGAGDQYVLDYARIFGLRTLVLRHSTIYGGRQFATYDQGWIGWFCNRALAARAGENNPFTISGTGKQVRDLLHAEDAVQLYYGLAERIDAVRGQPFNIGGGMDNSLSLLELFGILEQELGMKLSFEQLPPRESDQRVFVADTGKVRRALGWAPTVGHLEGVRRMLAWLSERGA